MLTRPARAVIFDMDGVLLDTEPLYTRATERVIAPYGKRYGWDVKQECIGRAERVSAEIICARLELPLTPEEYLARRLEVLNELLPAAPPMEGARELVEALAARSAPIAVATSSRSPLFSLKTRAHPWFCNFGVVVCGDDPELRRHKPDPDIFLLAAARLKATADECVVVEDAPAGVEAALRAGMQVVARVDPNLDPCAFEGATRCIASLRELDANALLGAA